jgi:hypothetical protein
MERDILGKAEKILCPNTCVQDFIGAFLIGAKGREKK